jgi:hypothetical protein
MVIDRARPDGDPLWLLIEHCQLAGLDVSFETHDIKVDRSSRRTIKSPRFGRVVELSEAQVKRLHDAARSHFVRGDNQSIYRNGATHSGSATDSDVPMERIVYCVPYVPGMDQTVIPDPIGSAA